MSTASWPSGRIPSWKKRRFERRKGLVNTAGPVWKASELGCVEAKGALCFLSSRFLELAPTSGLKWTELAEAGEYWWNNKLPRDVLSAAQGAA